MKTTKQLAKIASARLDIQERGILNFWINVNYEDGGVQGVGGIALDRFCSTREKRVGTAYGCEVIRRLLLELGVDDFSEMKGKHIWVIGEGEGFGLKPTGIQALSSDNPNSEPVIFSEIPMDL